MGETVQVKYSVFEEELNITSRGLPLVDAHGDSATYREQDAVSRATTYRNQVTELATFAKPDAPGDPGPGLLLGPGLGSALQRGSLALSMARPHVLSGMRDIGEIVLCPQVQHPYRVPYPYVRLPSPALAPNVPTQVLLNKTDISYGAFGFYNFYRLELIHRRSTELYVVFTNWGRIGPLLPRPSRPETGQGSEAGAGDEGQFQKTPFARLEEAVKEFRTIFRAKTGNDWADVSNFQVPRLHSTPDPSLAMSAGVSR